MSITVAEVQLSFSSDVKVRKGVQGFRGNWAPTVALRGNRHQLAQTLNERTWSRSTVGMLNIINS